MEAVEQIDMPSRDGMSRIPEILGRAVDWAMRTPFCRVALCLSGAVLAAACCSCVDTNESEADSVPSQTASAPVTATASPEAATTESMQLIIKPVDIPQELRAVTSPSVFSDGFVYYTTRSGDGEPIALAGIIARENRNVESGFEVTTMFIELPGGSAFVVCNDVRESLPDGTSVPLRAGATLNFAQGVIDYGSDALSQSDPFPVNMPLLQTDGRVANATCRVINNGSGVPDSISASGAVSV